MGKYRFQIDPAKISRSTTREEWKRVHQLLRIAAGLVPQAAIDEAAAEMVAFGSSTMLVTHAGVSRVSLLN